jgi:HAD superfamily hydrolase (TIGR01509 family)
VSGLQAVLWDMDGLLVDSEPTWDLAEIELAAQLGGTWDEGIKALVVGTRLELAVPTILRYYGAPDGPTEVAQTSAWLLDRMVQLFASTSALMPGAAELLAALAAEGVPMALVSSSYRVLIDAVLAQGVGPFALTLAGDEVVLGKPHPEPYLTAAQRLGADPRRCVVLEDSPAGVVAGEAAGCAVVAIPSVPGVAFAPCARRLVASSLTQVTVQDLRQLL